MGKLSTAIKLISNKLDQTTKLMMEIKAEISTIKKNEELQVKNAVSTSDVDVLKTRVRSLEHCSRRSKLEISGPPITQE